MKVAETPSIASRIALAFQSASSTTGTDFGYLVKTASRESNFDAAAKARSSSATGLFQFIESTWLETVKTSGDKHGLSEYAADITRRSDGRYTVSDPARRREILDLRKDPEISALMAGELTRKNAAYLEGKLGREPSDGELYAAHFLGAGGASRLIRMADADPNRAADSVFPRQARANRSIFYDRSGSARSVSQVLAGLVAQHDSPSRIEYATVVAANKPVPTPVAKAQAIAAAAGVPNAGVPGAGGGDAQTVIASRYYRPEEASGLSDALASRARAVATADTGVSRGGGADAQTVIASRYYRPEEAEAVSEALTGAAKGTPEDETDMAPAQRQVASAAAGEASETTVSAVTAFAPGDAPMPPAAKPVRMRADAPAQPVGDAAVAVALAEAEQAEPPVMSYADATPAEVSVSPAEPGERRTPFDSGNASARISSAWRAAESSTPFQALFRTGEGGAEERFDNTFVTAFRAQPEALQAAVEAHAGAASAPEPAEQGTMKVADAGNAGAVRSDGRPFDLTGFLKYQIFKEPEDLVPPA